MTISNRDVIRIDRINQRPVKDFYERRGPSRVPPFLHAVTGKLGGYAARRRGVSRPTTFCHGWVILTQDARALSPKGAA